MSATLAAWLRYATTDPEVVGSLTWLGLVITIAGFWVAISQIQKVKKASEAANDAVLRLANVVRAQEQSARITNSFSHLGSAQAMIKQGNLDAAAAHLSVSWSSLVSAKELTEPGADRDEISGYVISVRRLLDDTDASHLSGPPTAQMLKQRHGKISKALSGLGTLSARLNALLSGIGTSP